jgi:dienelactone hydrolase
MNHKSDQAVLLGKARRVSVKKIYAIMTFVLLFVCFSQASAAIKTEMIIFSNLIDGKNYRQEAMLYIPLDGKEQHPLIIMTHGRNGPYPKINEREVSGLRELNQALANRGFLVMMLVRRGYGNSEGPDSEFLDTAEESGLAGAQDIKGAVNYMRTMPEVLIDRVAIIGQSQGGWVSLALSTLDVKGVFGAVNISGAINFRRGVGRPIRDSAVEDHLENSAKIYGKSARVPTLWIYAENDNHLPDAVRKWFNAYTKAGGKGRLAIKPPYKDQGHAIVREPDLYIEDILSFFKEIGFSN